MKTNTTTLNLPSQVIDSDWKDDIDMMPYKDEMSYVSPEKIKKETIARIKKSPIKLAIRDMVNWNKLTDQVTA